MCKVSPFLWHMFQFLLSQCRQRPFGVNPFNPTSSTNSTMSTSTLKRGYCHGLPGPGKHVAYRCHNEAAHHQCNSLCCHWCICCCTIFIFINLCYCHMGGIGGYGMPDVPSKITWDPPILMSYGRISSSGDIAKLKCWCHCVIVFFANDDVVVVVVAVAVTAPPPLCSKIHNLQCFNSVTQWDFVELPMPPELWLPHMIRMPLILAAG